MYLIKLKGRYISDSYYYHNLFYALYDKMIMDKTILDKKITNLYTEGPYACFRDLSKNDKIHLGEKF